MRLEITINGQKQAVVLEGRGTVGGGDDDTVRIVNAPPRLIEIWPEGPVWRVKTRVAGKVNGLSFPAHVSRVFCAGEVVELGGGMSLTHLPTGAGVAGTAAVLKDLLGDAEPEVASLPVFICLTGPDSGRRFSMVGNEALIGRSDVCQIHVRDGAVSRKHARVERLGSKFWIEDLDSPNGVFVNSRRMSRRAVLADGVVIELGQTLLRFHSPADNKPSLASGATPNIPPPAQKPPPPPPEALAEGRLKVTPLPAKAPAEPLAEAKPIATPLPIAAEPAPSLSLVEPEEEETAEPGEDVTEPSPAPFGIVEKAIVAGGLAMMAVGAVAAVLLS